MHDAEIQAIPFRGPSPPRRPTSFRKLILFALLVLLVFLGGLTWFVFTARQVAFRIEPLPDRMTLQGAWLAPRIGEIHLLEPGSYILKAEKAGYHALEEKVEVTEERDQTLRFTMQKLPGRISVTVHGLDDPEQTIQAARIYLDDRLMGESPVTQVEVEPGSYRMTVEAPGYQRLERQLEVEGLGIAQSVHATLLPAWANITVDSVPQGALVRVGQTLAGKTPATMRLPEGEHRVRVSLDRYKPWETTLKVRANEPQTLDTIRLEPADGVLAVRTDPAGATVTLSATYAGRTPFEIHVAPGRSHVLRISKTGYQETAHEVTVSSGERKEVFLSLVPVRGRIYLDVSPEGATLFIDGKSQGVSPEHVDLVAVEHDIEIRKPGYETFSVRMKPRPGFPLQLKVFLKKPYSEEKKRPESIETPDGSGLQLIRPATYTMGSSRRQQGRRSNETLRTVALRRPFYMAVKEVTNRQFRAFLAGHDSGMFRSQALNRDDQPVVRVTWEQAALFCNWLSAKASLPPAYVKKGDRLEATEPLGTGYRLPTEAEWEYCARAHAKGALEKYPWGEGFPPEDRTLNIADASARNLLSLVLEAYNDGYPVSAPVASFAANGLGIYDLGGNVSEWCHDLYSIYPYSPESVFEDPAGPRDGKHRVVRGSSWRHASISALRIAYRDYSNGSREDLGFRVCRYADEGEAGK